MYGKKTLIIIKTIINIYDCLNNNNNIYIKYIYKQSYGRSVGAIQVSTVLITLSKYVII